MNQETLAALGSIDTPTIGNAIEKFGVRSPTAGYASYRLRNLFPEMGILVGHAVTATIDTTTPREAKPSPNRWELYEVLEQTPGPAVVVLQAIGPNLEYSCVCGGGMATMMMQLGAEGLVTNGGVRDLADLRRLGFKCFSPGVVAAHGTIGIVDVNVPVEIDGVSIQPGALIHGDENGLVEIPDLNGDELLAEARGILEAERQMMEAIESDSFSLSAYRQARELSK